MHKKPTKIPDEIRNDCNSLTYWYGKVYFVGDLFILLSNIIIYE